MDRRMNRWMDNYSFVNVKTNIKDARAHRAQTHHHLEDCCTHKLFLWGYMK